MKDKTKHYHIRPIIPTYTIHAKSLEEAKSMFMDLWQNEEISYFADGNPLVEEKDEIHCDYCGINDEVKKWNKLSWFERQAKLWQGGE